MVQTNFIKGRVYPLDQKLLTSCVKGNIGKNKKRKDKQTKVPDFLKTKLSNPTFVFPN